MSAKITDSVEKFFLFYFGLLFLVVVFAEESSKNDCANVKCKGPIRYYEDLKCRPVYPEGTSKKCCPARYDCSHITDNNDKCLANGNLYDYEQKLKNEDRNDVCDNDCVCKKDTEGLTKFVCAQPICTGYDKMPTRRGCYLKKKLNTCCQMKQVCPPRFFKFLKVTCKYNGTTYAEGQEFDPYDDKSGRTICQCERGFKGKIVPPYCRNVTCVNEIKHLNEIRKNCAPLFIDHQTTSDECNVDYQCPEGTETIVRENRENKKDDSNACVYGKLTLNVGDKIVIKETTTEEKSLKCECELPPAITCFQSRIARVRGD